MGQQLVSPLKIMTVSYFCSEQKIARLPEFYHSLFSTSGVTIGFNGIYSVREDAGSISIVVLVLMNCLTRDVEVSVSSIDDTGRGRFAQCLTCMDRH